ncbi:hypothetical protein DSO57_1013439 [Entomophthora muscae]|uniref:Uncharacterized protein n=1 Tax=Entomophthora muscae TaxID=34485 RepID=A0ACC2SIQ1_9FUNG|nr:hypothetical protein DSO57_1013439 [Entomophthora muscae]
MEPLGSHVAQEEATRRHRFQKIQEVKECRAQCVCRAEPGFPHTPTQRLIPVRDAPIYSVALNLPYISFNTQDSSLQTWSGIRSA